jgi:N-acetyl sugar amidotransferase
MKLSYCKTCLTTNLRPNARFHDGTCSACLFSNRQHAEDVFEIKQKLVSQIGEILKPLRENQSNYDCLIGVSGGKDSLRQALWVRDSLNLRPLLVCCSYPPLQMLDLGARNISNLLEHGFDLEVVSPAPDTARLLSLQAFKKFGNVCKASEMALVSSIPRAAIEHNLPIAFFGENPALQEGDYSTMGEDEIDASKLGKLNTLGPGTIDWGQPSIPQYHLNCYDYPAQSEFSEAKLKMFYLGPVWEDWGITENAIYSTLNGLVTRLNDEDLTGDVTNASMLDEEFTNINMMIKYFKFGFGRATDVCNELIRTGKLSRDEAIEIIEKYDGVCSDEIIFKYCKWVGISAEHFWTTIKKFVNKDLFDVDGKRPKRKFKIGVDID